MSKVLGMQMPDVVDGEIGTNKLEVKSVGGKTKVFLNGAEVYDIKPNINLDISKHIKDRGVVVEMTMLAEVEISG